MENNVEYGLDDVGLTPATEYLIAIAGGSVPSSLKSEKIYIHFYEEGGRL